MEYSIQKMAQIAGISSRTLRYYDEIGLLKPARINSSGYRMYGQNEVDRLQQIMFYRELGFSLDRINDILSSPAFDSRKALEEHREQLLLKRAKLDLLIANVEKTICYKEGRIKTMSDEEKFEGFKQKLVEDNEEKYGEEIRAKYGENTINEANNKLLGMSQENFEKAAQLEAEIKSTLTEAFKTGNPASPLAQKAASLHKDWICCYWKKYTKEAHAGLARIYVGDERFKAYYDKDQPGSAEFLRDAILQFTGQME
ncbi:MerR family transcriptional regulator [Bacillus massilinigeriensis]|uniref:MerR family transcriptional regulator n=1 Tax=Bacillus mediterraneensis TaxID=1805474 RepID=UPI0008F8972D|nr:MerR family transcriptional regulator [Bacillus mediterraneensis]